MKNYKFEEIYEFDRKLRFSYSDLKWVDDDNLFMPIQRKQIKGIMTGIYRDWETDRKSVV